MGNWTAAAPADHFLPPSLTARLCAPTDDQAALRLLRHLCGARETNSRRRSFLRLFLLSKRSSRVTCSFVGFLTAYCRLLPPRHTRSLRCLPRPEIISNFTQWLDRKNKLEEWITNGLTERKEGREDTMEERVSIRRRPPAAFPQTAPVGAEWQSKARHGMEEDVASQATHHLSSVVNSIATIWRHNCHRGRERGSLLGRRTPTPTPPGLTATSW